MGIMAALQLGGALLNRSGQASAQDSALAAQMMMNEQNMVPGNKVGGRGSISVAQSNAYAPKGITQQGYDTAGKTFAAGKSALGSTQGAFTNGLSALSQNYGTQSNAMLNNSLGGSAAARAGSMNNFGNSMNQGFSQLAQAGMPSIAAAFGQYQQSLAGGDAAMTNDVNRSLSLFSPYAVAPWSQSSNAGGLLQGMAQNPTGAGSNIGGVLGMMGSSMMANPEPWAKMFGGKTQGDNNPPPSR